MRKNLAIAGIAGAVATAVIAVAPAAMAASRDGVCDSGEFCLYYNSDQQGSVSDFATSIADYGDSQPSCYEFKGSGSGQDRCVKNDAASVWNRTSSPVTVYYNSDHRGASQAIAAGARTNLNSVLKNENASHRFGTNTTGNENMSYALYNLTGGAITCGFDGYQNTPGKHEGIDIARSVGSAVYALTPGTIVNIERGYNGSGGLSTIAVYNASYNATVIYLHAAPIASLAEGQTIRRDQLIAHEGWRGVSSSGGAHTHIEVRSGRRTNAAKSVNDYDLENTNPTQFWNARGYHLR